MSNLSIASARTVKPSTNGAGKDDHGGKGRQQVRSQALVVGCGWGPGIRRQARVNTQDIVVA